jgi:mRNA-degrading endonuclease RelE of RelBE toxin-antitoxin system
VTGGAATPYDIHLAPPGRRALRRLPEKVATAAIEFIYGPLASNPTRVGRLLRFELEGAYSAHRGDYRVVYRIDEERRRVLVLAIGHRADIYRRP